MREHDMSSSSQVTPNRIARRTVRIEWGDCDPAGIVYFPRYFAIFDSCTAGAFEAVGAPKPWLIQHYGIIGFPIVDVRGSFHLPSRFGEDVVVETQITEWGRSSFKVRHRLLKGDALGAEGHEVRVWSGKDPENPGRLKGLAVPEEIKVRFQLPSPL
jgi:4-hydroxybenzoyl-CoA thioesterase